MFTCGWRWCHCPSGKGGIPFHYSVLRVPLQGLNSCDLPGLVDVNSTEGVFVLALLSQVLQLTICGGNCVCLCPLLWHPHHMFWCAVDLCRQVCRLRGRGLHCMARGMIVMTSVCPEDVQNFSLIACSLESCSWGEAGVFKRMPCLCLHWSSRWPLLCRYHKLW